MGTYLVSAAGSGAGGAVVRCSRPDVSKNGAVNAVAWVMSASKATILEAMSPQAAFAAGDDADSAVSFAPVIDGDGA